MANLTSIRSNPPTPASMAQNASAVPANAMPATIEELVDHLTPVVAKFRDAATPQRIALPLEQPTIGGPVTGSRIAQVGLADRIVSWHHVVINLANTGGGAQTAQFSPWFPYDLIALITVGINGGETPFSCSGRGSLAAFARDRGGFWQPKPGGAGLSAAVIQQFAAGANLTLTASPVGSMAQLGGNTQVSVALGANGNLTLDFFTVAKLCMSRDSLLGMLPLQNNQTFATIATQPAATLLTTANNPSTAPLFNAGANLAATITTWNVQHLLYMWGIPADAGLYQPLIENSYQVIEQKAVAIPATGQGALTYGVPSNAYFKAAHLFVTDSAGLPVAPANLTQLRITYNAGAVTPYFSFPERERFAQYADYDADLGVIPGYRLWDGDDTSELLNITDNAGWVDTYSAAEPQLIADVAGTVATPAQATITREQIVAGAVQQLGG